MTETFQLTRAQAQAYDDLFVPALFGQWAPQLVDCARVRHGQSVLDVACGTGVVARAARDVVGHGGRVVGVDLNPRSAPAAEAHGAGAIRYLTGDYADLSGGGSGDAGGRVPRSDRPYRSTVRPFDHIRYPPYGSAIPIGVADPEGE